MTEPGLKSVLDADIVAQIHELEDPGEPSLLAELIAAFQVSARHHVAGLKAALAAGDATAFGDAAHALKGSAASLGAVRLQDAAGRLERRGREHNLDNLAPGVGALEADCAEALAALQAEEIRYAHEVATHAPGTSS